MIIILPYPDQSSFLTQKQVANVNGFGDSFTERDMNGDGVIGPEELQQMCPNMDKSETEMIAMFDGNGDGGIDEAEFNKDDKEFAAGLSSCWQLVEIPLE